MDYIGIKCPVCQNTFTQDDDVVVCPECGTPHHRECYEKNGECINYQKHKDGYTFDVSKQDTSSQSTDNTGSDKKVCPRCKTENPENMFYCGKCGFPLGMKQYENPQKGSSVTVNVNGNTFDPFDPMAGIAPDTEMGEDVTAGEIAKYVQNNTSYFLRVFTSLKNSKRGRFSFVGFLFGGGYLLYRKMYTKGIILTAVTAILLIVETLLCLSPQYAELSATIQELMNNAPSLYSAEFTSHYTEFMKSLDLSSIIMLSFIYVSAGVQIAIKIIVALSANKWYFKHCKKKISTIKKKNPENLNQELEHKGGVNKALAASLMVVYLIISYLPMML